MKKNVIFFVVFALQIFAFRIFAQDSKPDISRAITRASVRVTAFNTNNPAMSVGAGFYYEMGQSNNFGIPTLVTCWHVISGYQVTHVDFALVGTNDPYKRIVDRFPVNFPITAWIRDPDTNVDLAVLPLAGIMTVSMSETGN